MKKLSSTNGYTLIEMVVVIDIDSMTIVAVTAAVIIFYRTNGSTLNQAYAIESARQGIQLAVKNIRGIQYGADGSYPVVSIATSSFVFYSDVTGDGVAERVEYYLSGTKFIQGVVSATGSPPTYTLSSESTSTESDSVRNGLEGVPVFHFYNASSTEIMIFSTTTAVSYVTVDLIVNENLATSTGDYTLRSTAALRNVTQF